VVGKDDDRCRIDLAPERILVEVPESAVGSPASPLCAQPGASRGARHKDGEADDRMSVAVGDPVMILGHARGHRASGWRWI
jgi:hypothetical protein